MDQLTSAVTAAFKKIVDSGSIEQAIEEQLTQTINTLIAGQLRNYSAFSKALEVQIAKALEVDFDRLDLPSYGDMILKIVRKKVEQSTGDELTRSVEAQLTHLLNRAPDEISLQKLVNEFIEANAERSGDSNERITLHVEESSVGSSLQWIYLDHEEGKSRYDCEIRFLYSRHDGKITALRLDKQDVEKTIFLGFHGFERTLFQMHAAGTKLTGVDEHIETYYPGRD